MPSLTQPPLGLEPCQQHPNFLTGLQSSIVSTELTRNRHYKIVNNYRQCSLLALFSNFDRKSQKTCQAANDGIFESGEDR